MKVKSHIQRMSERDVPTGFIAGDFEEFSTEQVTVNGRAMKKSVVKKVSPAERMAAYNVADFYLENILAAGATDALKPLKYGASRMDALDSVDEAIFNFSEPEMVVNNEVKNEE